MIYAKEKQYTLIQDDMLNMGDYIADGTIDCVITDPPYELGFMGKSWDNSGIAFKKDTWSKCFNALKDGGYLLAFGGTRTFHRIACAIEDAGFEIRDTIMYLYGSGFPKSLNIGLAIDKLNGVESKVVGKIKGAGSIGKNDVGNQTFIAKNQYDDGTHDIKQATNEWQGWGTALKPAYEPIIVARKPMKTTVAENVLKNGVGGINIDECRVETNEVLQPSSSNKMKYGGNSFNESSTKNDPNWIQNQKGRFPANIIHDGSDEVVDNFPSEIGEENASRFFYTAKASKKDRDDGLEAFEERTQADINGRKEGSKGTIREYGGGTNPFLSVSSIRRNIHPTVKPIELMQYLVRMVAPKGATILDCFMGSGSTGKAVMFENRERDANYKFVGIELTEEYLPICQARIEYAINKYEYDEKLEQAKTGQLSIFDIMEEAK